MVKYNCLCCEFETDRKSTYDNHMKSSKHLRRMNGSVVSSTLSTLSYTEATTKTDDNRITDLEYQLKMKDIEIQNIINEYTLKLQMKDMEIKYKDDMIKMLQQGIQKVEEPNIKMVITEKPTNKIQLVPPVEEIPIIDEKKETIVEKSSNISLKEKINQHFSNAPTFQHCYKTLLKLPEYNNYLIELNGDTDKIVLSTEYFKPHQYQDNGVDNAVKIISNFFTSFENNKLPFYCSDKQRKVLYIKNDDGWIKSTDNENDFDKEILNLAKFALSSVSKAMYGTINIFKDKQKTFEKLYGCNYNDWLYSSKSEILDAISLMGGIYGKSNKSDTQVENEKLVVKKLKSELARISKSIFDE